MTPRNLTPLCTHGTEAACIHCCPPHAVLETHHLVLGHAPIKDSGVREEFDTGSRRDTREGKGRFDLLPPRGLARLARHFEAGAKKYGDDNWTKGQPASRFLDSALRHAFKFRSGETDEDHLIAAVWNLLCLADQQERIKEGKLPNTLNDL